MPLIIPANSITGGYEVDNSLRFENTSTDGLTRTITSSGNRRTWTWSGWVKRSKLTNTTGDPQILFNSGQNTSGILDFNVFRFNTDDRFLIAGVSNNGATTNYAITTNAVYRDVSAWYHVVVAFDSTQGTSSDRIKLYINGVQVTSFSSTTYPSLNYDSFVNFVTRPYYGIGDRINTSGQLFAGYMAEVVLIDGSALDPTSFGEFDADTGIWKPIAVSGLTFGTNGFYLDFENSGSLGADVSGNGNNFTVNNLTSIDQVTDTPTNNFATLNPLNNVGTGANPIYSEGNLKVISSADNYFGGSGSIGVTTGKWYLEIELDAQSSSGQGVIGMSTNIFEEARQNRHVGQLTNFPSVGYYGSNGNKVIDGGTDSAYGNSYTAGDIIGIAIDLENNYIYFAKNGTWQNSGVPTSGATGTGAISLTSTTREWFLSLGDGGSTSTATYLCNFGNPAFTIASGNSDANGYGNFEYAVPSGYYALCTKNLAEFG